MQSSRRFLQPISADFQPTFELVSTTPTTMLRRLALTAGLKREPLSLSDTMYELDGFRKSTPPQNRQLVVYHN